MAENIHKNHRQRTKNKFIKSKFTGFADHEKLELLLYYAIPMRDTNPIAHNLMNRFNNLADIFDASIEQLTAVDGIGENAAILIKLIPELAKEYSLSQNCNVLLDSTEKVCEFFSTQFMGEVNEKIKVACVDDNLKLICCEDLAEGTTGSVYMDIRRLAKFTYDNNSENIIIAHNHPNGNPLPSNEDIRQTAEIYKTLSSIGVTLLDHIVVAKGQATSLKSVGAFSML